MIPTDAARPAERRRHGRFAVSTVRSNLGDVLDLSAGGIRVVSSCRLAGEKTVTLRGPTSPKVTVVGHVAWCRRLGFRRFISGIRFVNVPTDVLRRLLDLRSPGDPLLPETDDTAPVPPRLIGAPSMPVLVGACAAGLAALGLWWRGLLTPATLESVLNAAADLGLTGLAVALAAIAGLIGFYLLLYLRLRPAPLGEGAPSAAPGPEPDNSLLRCILDSSLDGVAVLMPVRDDVGTVTDFTITLVNTAAEQILGRPAPQLLNARVSMLHQGQETDELLQQALCVFDTGIPIRQERRLTVASRWYRFAIVRLGPGLLITFSDVTDQHVLQAELHHSAYHDGLTGLPNRKLLLERLQSALHRLRVRKGRKLAVLFCDFDGFKLVNDTLGHSVGDQLLVAIAHRLRTHLRAPQDRRTAGDLAARLGGDEFVVVLDGIDSASSAIDVANRLVQDLRRPHQLGPHQVVSTASIGVVVLDGAWASVDDVLKDADAAMYRAKLAGKSTYMLFEESMRGAPLPGAAGRRADLDAA